MQRSKPLPNVGPKLSQQNIDLVSEGKSRCLVWYVREKRNEFESERYLPSYKRLVIIFF